MSRTNTMQIDLFSIFYQTVNKMKIKAAAIPVIFLLMATLPFGAGISAKKGMEKSKTVSAPATADESESTDNANSDNALICRIIENEFGSGYSQAALNAFALLVSTNYYCEPEKYNSDNYNSDSEISDNVKQAVNYAANKKLYYNNETVYVPYSSCSNGATLQGEYTYLSAVASPQDYFSQNYSPDNECFGVSADGIEYLCENDASTEDALLYYLPGFEIK